MDDETTLKDDEIESTGPEAEKWATTDADPDDQDADADDADQDADADDPGV